MLRAIVTFVTLDLLNCQETQKVRNTAYVQPYEGKIRDIFKVWDIKETFVREGFWSRVQMALWLVAFINVTEIFL